MGKAVRHMVEDALDVYLNSDERRAYEIAASDEIIDNYFRDIQAMTVEGVRKNPDAAFAAKEYFQVLMYLERIGDYARNLCYNGFVLNNSDPFLLQKSLISKHLSVCFDTKS